MNIFSALRKALTITPRQQQGTLVPASNLGWGYSRGMGYWGGVIRESFTGAWQQNVEVRLDSVLAYSAVFSCISLITTNIGKLRIKLVQEDADGVWTETESAAFSPVLRKPNHYQNRIKFIEQWITSKLVHGNAYVLKVRDARNVVVELFVLDPCTTVPLVSPDGSVFYRLRRDYLSGVNPGMGSAADIRDNDIVVPASEIIHDTMICLFHPLVGVSPIFACGLAAVNGLNIQNNSANFFGNMSQPGGILTAPGAIADETAQRLSELWNTKFRGANAGRVAVVGDGLKYEQLSIAPVDAQLIEQLKYSAQTVADCFHVPAFLVGAGPIPQNANVESLWQMFYSMCLQELIESLELCLDEGLELPKPFGTEVDLDGLIRMDAAQRIQSSVQAIAGGLFTTNEERKRFNRKPVEGGDDVRAQQQQFSLAALAERDQDKPFAKPAPAPAADPASDGPGNTPQPPAPPAPDDRGLPGYAGYLLAKRLGEIKQAA